MNTFAQELNKRLLSLALLAFLCVGTLPSKALALGAISVESSEETMFVLEQSLGKLLFEPLSSATGPALARNQKRFLELRQAALPFHEYMINAATHLKNEINKKGEVDSLAFNILDRGFFGYQAILRKLLELENSYSEMNPLSQEARKQIQLAHGLTALIGADLYQVLFKSSRVRLMVKDLLDEVRPKQAGYERRNEELQLLFVRALEEEFRNETRQKLKQLIITKKDIAPFSLSRLYKVLDQNSTYDNFEFSDSLSAAASDTTYALSKIFGIVVGNIKLRKGHFYQRPDVTQFIASELRPFDILLDKAPFGLSDRFIPGHYTHAGIYLGTKEQLQELGLWDHPQVKPFQQEIAAGKVIAEALRPGTKMSALSDFQNVDEIAAYRVKDITRSKAYMEMVIAQALDQIGKEYDFNFDVSTKSVIVCSELVYHSFADIHWPTSHKVGRETISPDNLAELAFYDNSPLELVFAIYAEAPGELKERTKSEVAQILGFRELEDEGYEYMNQVCHNIKRPHIRVGSRRERHLVMRQCHSEGAVKVYN